MTIDSFVYDPKGNLNSAPSDQRDVHFHLRQCRAHGRHESRHAHRHDGHSRHCAARRNPGRWHDQIFDACRKEVALSSSINSRRHLPRREAFLDSSARRVTVRHFSVTRIVAGRTSSVRPSQNITRIQYGLSSAHDLRLNTGMGHGSSRRAVQGLASILLLIALAAGANAQESDIANVQACNTSDPASAEPQINGCTALISSLENPRALATAYNNRGQRIYRQGRLRSGHQRL